MATATITSVKEKHIRLRDWTPMRRRRQNSGRVHSLLRSQFIDAVPLSAAETTQLQQRWRDAFAVARRANRDAGISEEFDWHVFSHGVTKCLVGEEARQAYRTTDTTGSIYVVPHQTEDVAYEIAAPKLKPDFSGKTIDAYIVPADYSWTMVYTHESASCGPYFARIETEQGVAPTRRSAYTRMQPKH